MKGIITSFKNGRTITFKPKSYTGINLTTLQFHRKGKDSDEYGTDINILYYIIEVKLSLCFQLSNTP